MPIMGPQATHSSYSSITESARILDFLIETFQDGISLPSDIRTKRPDVQFIGTRDQPYFPIPFKETETGAALKAVEASVAALLADVKDQEAAEEKKKKKSRRIVVNLEKTTAFLFQAYLARVGGLGKLDKNVRGFLKGLSSYESRSYDQDVTNGILDTDLLRAQSDPYRRMSANLYETAEPGEYYHIHGSLEASTTLGMIGLEPFNPELKTHEDIVNAIEPAVKKFTVAELESLNAKNRQAGVKAYKHTDFLQTPHVCSTPVFETRG